MVVKTKQIPTTRARGGTALTKQGAQLIQEGLGLMVQAAFQNGAMSITQSEGTTTGTRGGTSAQHAKAGRASAKARRSNASGLHAS